MYVVPGDTFDRPQNAPSLQDEPLFVHRRQEGEQKSHLIIFVHGLGGDRYSTWENGPDDKNRPKSFPRFIFEDEEPLQEVDIGLYAYVSGLKRVWFWRASIDLEVEAKILADTLRDANNYDHIILIGHSMGGILIKAAITDLITRHDDKTLKRLCGLFLLATPQIGSLRVPGWLSLIHKDAQALKPHNNLLRHITETFQRSIRNSDLDGGDTPQVYVLPAWAAVAAEDFWVDALSAGLGITDDRRKNVRGSHKRIVKPTHRNEETYRWVVQNVRACFDQRIDANQDLEPQRQLKTLLNKYPLPLVEKVNPYDMLGVSKSEHVDRFLKEKGKWPPYIPRKQADDFLDNLLEANRFVLITGLSKSGKSRTAFEAIRRNFQNRDYFMIAPARPGDPSQRPTILEEYGNISKIFPNAVLWLDDMERFLDTAVLNVNLINQIFKKHKTLIVVGTMRSMEYDRLTSATGEISRLAACRHRRCV